MHPGRRRPSPDDVGEQEESEHVGPPISTFTFRPLPLPPDVPPDYEPAYSPPDHADAVRLSSNLFDAADDRLHSTSLTKCTFTPWTVLSDKCSEQAASGKRRKCYTTLLKEEFYLGKKPQLRLIDGSAMVNSLPFWKCAVSPHTFEYVVNNGCYRRVKCPSSEAGSPEPKAAAHDDGALQRSVSFDMQSLKGSGTLMAAAGHSNILGYVLSGLHHAKGLPSMYHRNFPPCSAGFMAGAYIPKHDKPHPMVVHENPLPAFGELRPPDSAGRNRLSISDDGKLKVPSSHGRSPVPDALAPATVTPHKLLNWPFEQLARSKEKEQRPSHVDKFLAASAERPPPATVDPVHTVTAPPRRTEKDKRTQLIMWSSPRSVSLPTLVSGQSLVVKNTKRRFLPNC